MQKDTIAERRKQVVSVLECALGASDFAPLGVFVHRGVINRDVLLCIPHDGKQGFFAMGWTDNYLSLVATDADIQDDIVQALRCITDLAKPPPN